MTLASDLANTHRNIAFNDAERARNAKASSDALALATVRMFRRTAEREGITIEEAGLRALYGAEKAKQWRAAQ